MNGTSHGRQHSLEPGSRGKHGGFVETEMQRKCISGEDSLGRYVPKHWPPLHLGGGKTTDPGGQAKKITTGISAPIDTGADPMQRNIFETDIPMRNTGFLRLREPDCARSHLCLRVFESSKSSRVRKAVGLHSHPAEAFPLSESRTLCGPASPPSVHRGATWIHSQAPQDQGRFLPWASQLTDRLNLQ